MFVRVDRNGTTSTAPSRSARTYGSGVVLTYSPEQRLVRGQQWRRTRSCRDPSKPTCSSPVFLRGLWSSAWLEEPASGSVGPERPFANQCSDTQLSRDWAGNQHLMRHAARLRGANTLATSEISDCLVRGIPRGSGAWQRLASRRRHADLRRRPGVCLHVCTPNSSRRRGPILHLRPDCSCRRRLSAFQRSLTCLVMAAGEASERIRARRFWIARRLAPSVA